MTRIIFQDTEELSDALKYARVQAVQVSRGQYRAELERHSIQDWSLQYIDFQIGSSTCAGDAARDRYAILIPDRIAANNKLLGRPIEHSTIAFYAPGSEHADVTHGGSRAAVLFLPKQLPEWSSSDIALTSYSGSQLVTLSSVELSALRQLLQRIPIAALETEGILQQSEVQRSLADALMRAVLNLSPQSPGQPVTRGRPRLSRPAMIRRTWEILHERQDDPIYATELAAEVGISQPTLQRLFLEWFGMPPARYLQIKRYYLARRRLRDGTMNSVTEVATSLGFWDLSRFSKSYKTAFGELPSQTLRRARQQ